jgi:hypothetical protein
MKSQKAAVIDEVLVQLPNFSKFKDKAILSLSNAQLEAVKDAVTYGIQQGHIEYSKPVTNVHEVRTYARSMVMNHIKKAKELNGNMIPGTAGATKAVKLKTPMPGGVDLSLLPDDFKEYVTKLL